MENLNHLYKKAFQGIDEGFSYEQMSEFTGIPVELLKSEHIRESRQSKNYPEQIQNYTFDLIKEHGIQILHSKNINEIILPVPYRFRAAVKHFLFNLKKQAWKRGLDALSRN